VLAYFLITSSPGFIIPFRLIGLRFRDFVMALLPQLTITAIMAALCVLFLQWLPVSDSRIRLAATVIVGVLTYTLLLRILNPPVIDELCHILSHVRYRRTSQLLASVFRLDANDFGKRAADI